MNGRLPQVPTIVIHLGQRDPIDGFRTLPQEAFQEQIAQAVLLPGVEKESQEAGMHHLLMDKPYGFEDVETVEQLLYLFQIRSIGLQYL